MTTMDTYEPDYAKAQSLAYETITNSGIKTLPLNLKEIVKQCSNLRLISYKKFGTMRNMAKEEVIKWAQSEEGCLWYSKNDNTYLILYNESIDNKARRRFTIAHELGHYFLKHNEFTERSLLSRNSLTKIEHDAFEKEANYFAKRLLAPLPIIDLYLQELKKINRDLLINVFDISFSASSYLIEDLYKQRENGIPRPPNIISRTFKNFVYQDTHFFICRSCKQSSYRKPNNCLICGKKRFLAKSVDLKDFSNKYNFFLIKRSTKQMHYYSIPLDEHSKAITCPVCENEVIDDFWDNCQVCGTFLYNRCCGIDESDYGEYSSMNRIPVKEIAVDHGCGEQLPGNARFCKCGKFSTFYVADILEHWEAEKSKHVEISELPF
ncbi:ImmA/IrrE family metallo-endopeptidase [Listeria monocytogenes]|nr:ImmA/IrrE family metallo-endopeptidase [Listeria monocytogenes]EAD4384216.1 ImmA/IrrE family metallo-endopeptidase [Listeria monocytogenes]EAD4387270.1 ImmA/IrrE family metallo-endopeptidase [Listeria monocytogenes]EAE4958897.1 ImmA/IrrE family metallo-endopeptidase [Listeria monocytogenes]EAE9969993.1 ImmA/IrrE family metallo-endopeptidase [Listeria monocytogenes]